MRYSRFNLVVPNVLAIVLLTGFLAGESIAVCNYKCVEDNTCYATFIEAYTTPAPMHMGGVTILAKAVLDPASVPESMDIDWVPATVIGGFDDTFDHIVGESSFTSITVSARPLTIENVLIE